MLGLAEVVGLGEEEEEEVVVGKEVTGDTPVTFSFEFLQRSNCSTQKLNGPVSVTRRPKMLKSS